MTFILSANRAWPCSQLVCSVILSAATHSSNYCGQSREVIMQLTRRQSSTVYGPKDCADHSQMHVKMLIGFIHVWWMFGTCRNSTCSMNLNELHTSSSLRPVGFICTHSSCNSSHHFRAWCVGLLIQSLSPFLHATSTVSSPAWNLVWWLGTFPTPCSPRACVCY